MRLTRPPYSTLFTLYKFPLSTVSATHMVISRRNFHFKYFSKETSVTDTKKNFNHNQLTNSHLNKLIHNPLLFSSIPLGNNTFNIMYTFLMLGIGVYIIRDIYKTHHISKKHNQLIDSRELIQNAIKQNKLLLIDKQSHLEKNIRLFLKKIFSSIEEFENKKLLKEELINSLNYVYLRNELIKQLIDNFLQKEINIVLLHSSELPKIQKVRGWTDPDNKTIALLWDQTEDDLNLLAATLTHEIFHSLVSDKDWLSKMREFRKELNKDLVSRPEDIGAIIMSKRQQQVTNGADYFEKKHDEELLALTIETIVLDILLNKGSQRFLPSLPHVADWLANNFIPYLNKKRITELQDYQIIQSPKL